MYKIQILDHGKSTVLVCHTFSDLVRILADETRPNIQIRITTPSAR